PHARLPEPVYLRRQHLAHIKRHESDCDHRRNVAVVQRAPCPQSRQPAGTRMNFGPNDRAWLARLADELIPAGKGALSASQADVGGRGLDLVLTARPDLANGLADLIAKTRGKEAAAAVDDIRNSDAAAFGVLTEFAAAAYFMNPEVQRAIGYTGQTP